MKTNLLVALFLLISAVGFSQQVGNTAPNFTLTDTDDQPFTLTDFKGKVVAVFLFGYSCSSCQAIAPTVQSKLADAFKDDEDFVIVGVDTWNGSKSQVQNFKSNTNINFRALQQGSTMANSWGTTYDRIVIIDKEGRMAFKGGGLVSSHINDAVTAVQTALANTQTSIFNIKSQQAAISIFPNPVSSLATVELNLEESEIVSLSVYNLSGKKVLDLTQTRLTSGNNSVSFNVESLKTGIHFLQIKSENLSQTIRFTVN